MKIKLEQFFLLLFIILISCNDAARAEISIDGLSSRLTHKSFTIYNLGNSDLVIEGFTSSCECTIMNLKKGSRIASGDSLVVPVKVNPENQDKDMTVFISILTNAKPRVTSFKFEP